jgi:hypothetical protein
MSPRADTAPGRPAHRSRTAHPTPWSRPATRHLGRTGAVRRVRPAPPPVFVDDSGRRRRAGRLVGICLATLVLSYVAVVGLTFSGAPLVNRLAPPGVDRLSRPGGDDGLSMGPDAEESPLPPAALGSGAPSEGRDVTGAVTTRHPAGTPAPPTTAPVASTTTTAPGRSTNSTVPTPSSTVPEHTHTTHGPPAEPPGKP